MDETVAQEASDAEDAAWPSPKDPARRRVHHLSLGPWGTLLPVLIAAILSSPCLTLGYFWDDFYFLTGRAQADFHSYFLPDPQAAFYRPLTQGFYFLFLRIVDPFSGTVGHILNLGFLACTIVLLVMLVTRLSGPRAGHLAGLALASFGLVPSLVAWISCGQDLIAVTFVLAAFVLRHDKKDVRALACATAALLCKEPAIAAFPVLAFWDRIVGRPDVRPRFQRAAYGAVVLAWLLIHPGIHKLITEGFRKGAVGYVGLEHPWQWGVYLLRYVMTLANLPPRWLTPSWWDERVGLAFIAVAVLLGGFLLLANRRPSAQSSTKALPLWRVGLLAALFGVPTLLMPTMLIGHWAPYFAFFPAVALAMVLGPLVARYRTDFVVAALIIFIVMGIRFRGIESDREPVWTERVFVQAASATHTVHDNFRAALPKIAKGSQVVVSVASTGVQGIYSTLVEGQALRVWYWDHTIQTVPTLQRRASARPELLVRVTEDLDVIVIDPESRQMRASGAGAPDSTEIARPVVNYARAVAAGGDTERALRIVDELAVSESGAVRDHVERMGVMIRLAAGRREQAAIILASLPSVPREDALWAVMSLLSESSASESLDMAAFEAFGLSASDPEAIRWVMKRFGVEGARAQEAWYAQKLCRLLPGDPEGTAVLRSADSAGVKPKRGAA